MSISKSILWELKSKLQQKDHTALYYHSSDGEKIISYWMFFQSIDLFSLTIQQLHNIYLDINFLGLYTQQALCVPGIIAGCVMIDQPFICLDTEAGVDHIVNLIESINIQVIITTSGEFEELNKHLTLASFFGELELWGIKLQFWVMGNIGKKKRYDKKIMYAIQTSGSTGKPKIVQVPEESILPNIFYLRSEWSVTEDDVIALASPPTFDPFMVELLLAFSCGAAMFVLSPEVRASPNLLLDVLFPVARRSCITIIQFTPSIFTRWTSKQIRNRVLTKDTSLKVLALGGESFPPPKCWSSWCAPENQTRLFSLYGTTELSCWAMLGSVLDLTLGTPMSNTLLRVETEDGTQVTDGTGELFIGSDSRICLVDMEQWSQLQPPVFRATGDIVSVKNGVYRYMGRKDNVVKRWGNRVSLEQVEAVALECEDLAEAYCALHADCLALFVRLQDGSPGIQVVRERVKQIMLKKLNKASFPDIVLPQDHFPLTRHGKVNRKKLNKILFQVNKQQTNFVNSVDSLQVLWRKYTHSETNDSLGFISAGGNSISTMQIVNHMTARGLDDKLANVVMTGMLNNKSLAECCELLSQHPNRGLCDMLYLKKDVGSNENNIKKLKRNHKDELIHIKMKGCTSNFLEYSTETLTFYKSWNYNLGKCVDASATCVIYKSGKNHVLVGSHAGRLAAIDLSSGLVVWETKLPDRIESSISPSGDGYFGLIGCYDGSVYCICLHNGAIFWSFNTRAMVKGTALWFMNSWIFGSYDYCVYCIGCDGELLWFYKTDGFVSTTPIALPTQGLVVVTSVSGQVEALNCGSGTVAWNTTLPSPIFSTPCVLASADISLLVIAEVAGILHALHPCTGAELWRFEAAGQIYSSLVSFKDVVVFGCYDGHLYYMCCSQQAGTCLWSLDMGSEVYATPCCLLPQYVVIATTAGHVRLVNMRSAKIASTINLPGQVFSSPIATNNYIVVGCRDDNLYCLVINK